MKKLCVLILSSLCLLTAGQVAARDDKQMFSIQDAMSLEAFKEKLDGSVRFYFAGQSHPAAVKKFGEFMSNKKTNAFGKSDKQACEWAFLSAMLSFQKRALSEGGNAVVNIRSYYKKHEVSSSTEFECGAGAIIAGVTFKGDVVQLAR